MKLSRSGSLYTGSYTPLSSLAPAVMVVVVILIPAVDLLAEEAPSLEQLKSTDVTAFVEAVFDDAAGMKAGVGFDHLWSVSHRGAAGLTVRMSGAYLPTNSVDGDVWLGNCDDYRHGSYSCLEKRRGFFVLALAAGFEYTLSQSLCLKWHIGIELLMSKKLESYSLLPFPAAGLALGISVLQRERLALLVMPMAEITVTYFSIEAIISLGLGLTLRFG